MIQMKNVSKRLGDFHLRNLNLEIEQGEYFVLLGPSGVGKTVLLEILAGLVMPDEGRVVLAERDITRQSPERRGFALVYQDYALFPHLDVLKNVTYGLEARSMGRDLARKKGHEALEIMGVDSLSRRNTETLSGGEKQRVALARAMVTQPSLLLLDEPLAAIDRDESERLRRVLKSTQRDTGITCLHVTHNVDEALFLADRIGVMMDGTLAQVGSVEAVFESPRSREVARFLGLRNVFQATTVDTDTCRVAGVEIFAQGSSSKTSNLWIRPEDVLLSKERFESSARNQFRCVVSGWERVGRLLEVQLTQGDLTLVALISQHSFDELSIEGGSQLYCTFKMSAVHCF